MLVQVCLSALGEILPIVTAAIASCRSDDRLGIAGLLPGPDETGQAPRNRSMISEAPGGGLRDTLDL